MKKKRFNLIEELRKFFSINAYTDIISWAEKNINFSSDISAQRNFLDFSLYPYQVDILKQWEDLKSIKTVTVVAPEQCRKNVHIHRWSSMANGVCTGAINDSLPFR